MQNIGTVEDRMFQFQQLFSGLKTVHDLGFLHGDIKLENIFMRKKRMFLADFGGACHKDVEVKNLTELVAGEGSRATTEMYSNDFDQEESCERAENGDREGVIEVERKRDVFALGCVLFMALTGVNPFQQVGNPRTFVGFPDKIPIEGIPQELKDLIVKMLDPEFSSRPDLDTAFNAFNEILHSKFEQVAQEIEEIKQQEGYE